MKFTVVLQPEEEGGFSVSCPALPGVVSQGETFEESLTNIREAIELMIEALEGEGVSVPEDTPEAVALELEQILKDRADDGLPLTIQTQEVDISLEIRV
jgi:antitoxin HicB